MRVLSNWRLHGLLGLVVVAGGLGWVVSHSAQIPAVPGIAPLTSWIKAGLDDKQSSMSQHTVLANYGALPLHFETNVGQSDPAVKFLAQGGGYALFLTNNEAVLRLSRGSDSQGQALASTVLRARLEGANPNPKLSTSEKQSSYSNYFIGNDPRQWHSGVAHYGRVHYDSVWPGIDLVYYGNQRQLEYDFIVQPGANPGLIRMSWHGADNLYIDNDGNLIAETALGPVRQHRPVIYQTIKGQRKSIEGRYALNGRQVSFALGDYDHSQALVIDPILVYSTYLGGGGLSNFNLTSIAVTPAGRAVVAGYTDNSAYPVMYEALQTTRKASYNTVVSKLDYNGLNLIYSTYIGGTQPGRANGIAINTDGEAYVAGTTLAADFPLTPSANGTPYQSNNTNSKGTGFVAKLAADGKSILYSTYLGGSGGVSGDHITAIALNALGQAHVTGDTDSSNFPEAGSKPAGSRSGFVSILSANGDDLLASTFLGGSGSDQPNAIALAAGDIFVAGSTTSLDLVALNSNAGGKDAFVSRLSGDAQTLRYTRYIGGTNTEEGYGVAADSDGNVWVAGSSRSSTFPVLLPPAGLPSEGSKAEGTETAFLTRLSSSGIPTYSTFLGLSGKATAVALNSGKQPVVVGQMTAAFSQPDALDQVPSDNSNGFIRALNSDGSLALSTALGGGHADEQITAVALDQGDGLYVTGNTRSTDFPLEKQVFDYSSSFLRSGFISKLSNGPEIGLTQNKTAAGVNQDVVLGWTVQGASSCRWRDESSDVGNAVSGNRIVSKPSLGTYEFTLDCLNADNQKSSETVVVSIVLPPTITLRLSRDDVDVSATAVGQNVLVTWDSTDTDGCTLSTKVTPPTGDPVTTNSTWTSSGEATYQPTTVGTEEYTMSCTGPASTTAVSASKTLSIVAKPSLNLTTTPSSNPLNAPGSIIYSWTSIGIQNGQCAITGSLTASSLDANSNRTEIISGAGKHAITLKCTSPTGIALERSSATTYSYSPGTDPVISVFESTDTSIPLYQNTTLSWKVSNATSCTKTATAGAAASTGTGSWAGSITSAAELDSGSALVVPQTIADHEYTLSCTGSGGRTSSRSLNVDVTIPPRATVTTLEASPNTLSLGQTATIRWTSLNATSCTASAPGWSENVNANGNVSFKPGQQGSVELSLTCTGAGGSSTPPKTILLTVTAAAISGDNNTGGDSGGPVDLLLLTGLGLLGFARRRSAP